MIRGTYQFISEPHLDLELSLFLKSIDARWYYLDKILKPENISPELVQEIPKKISRGDENIKFKCEFTQRMYDVMCNGNGYFFINKFILAENIEKDVQELITKCLENTQQLGPLGIAVHIETTHGEKSYSIEMAKRLREFMPYPRDQSPILLNIENNPKKKKNGAFVFVMVITTSAI